METLRFLDVLERCSRACGILPDSEDYTQEFAQRLAGWITTRLPDAWFYQAWRKVISTQQRTFEQPWSGTETYGAGDAVLYEGAYWQSLQAGNTGQTPAEGTWWTAYEPEAFVGFEQAWADETIGAVKRVTERDPRKTRTPTCAETFTTN
jgi:hypothetical protein